MGKMKKTQNKQKQEAKTKQKKKVIKKYSKQKKTWI